MGSFSLIILHEKRMPRQNKIILIVDDDSADRELLREILKEEFKTRTVSSGYQAIQLLEKENIDAVITNLMMPEMDGSELIIQIKDKSPDVPVVLVSGSFGDLAQKKKYEAYADFCIAKPIDPNVLISTVQSIINDSGE